MEEEKSKDVSNELSLVKMDTREDNKTTYQSPFRKKDQESPESEENQDSFEESAINIRNSVVIYQSNVDFTLSSAH